MQVNRAKQGFSDHLMDKAEQLCESGFFEASLVTAQSACEICCEQAFGSFLERRGIIFLQNALHELIPNYNVSNSKTEKLYNAIASDRIQQQPFWRAYSNLTQHRNKVVHSGALVTKAEAEGYLEAARRLIEYMDNATSGVELDQSQTAVDPLQG